MAFAPRQHGCQEIFSQFALRPPAVAPCTAHLRILANAGSQGLVAAHFSSLIGMPHSWARCKAEAASHCLRSSTEG